MKHLITNAYIILALSAPLFFFVEDSIAEQVRDHRDKKIIVHDHRKSSRTPVVGEYKMSGVNSRSVPDDLEKWLNKRMRGYALIAADHNDSNGRYNSIFKKLPKGNVWKYSVMIVPEDRINYVLKDASKKGRELIAITSEQIRNRGMEYTCFFKL